MPPALLFSQRSAMKTIHPLELEAMLEADKPVEIIDIRPIDEFERAHIAGAHWVAVQAITPADLIAMRELPLTEPLYLVSARGGLAQFTAEDLERENCDNIFVVDGGMKAWLRDGLPVVRNHTVADWIAERRARIGEFGVLA
jgi:rhodanese-related sulfurtransferase